MANKKVVVAFSGGLDTSYTVMKLTQDGWDVYAACANTGGFSTEQLKTNEENAYKLGAVKYVTLDVTHEYYEPCRVSVSSRPSPSPAMPRKSVPMPSPTVRRELATTRSAST